MIKNVEYQISHYPKLHVCATPQCKHAIQLPRFWTHNLNAAFISACH